MEFLATLFGAYTGYLRIVTILGDKRTEHYFKYPGDLEDIEAKVQEWHNKQGVNVYFYPTLLEQADPDSDSICSPVIAADLDMVSPALVNPRPDIIVESSKGRFQAYWIRNGHGTEFTPLSVNGPVIADANLKRIPGTRNWKYRGTTWTVREINTDGLDTFASVGRRRNLTGGAFSCLFRANDRWSLARLCARLGCDAGETYLVLDAAQNNAGLRPGHDGYMAASVLYRDALEAVRSGALPSLLTDDEIRSLAEGEDSGTSFVDQYLEWATKCTDSPRQYHVAGALTVLSVLLSPYICLPTAFGNIRCNLWFMILAGTTSTRKTTAMEMAVRLAECVEPDVMLGTDVNAEGAISALSGRDGKASLFYRDEFSGLIAEVAEKKYMAGVFETMTKLYDGSRVKRSLSNKVIDVKDPYFHVLCGGIKSKTIELLGTEHILSGFLPRFLLVCGWTRKEDMKLIGPPNKSTPVMWDGLVEYLDGLVGRYAPSQRLNLAASSRTHTPWGMTATHEAWARMQQLEMDATSLGEESNSPDIFGPMYERCKNSIIKSAVLLAADRAYRGECEPVLELKDILKAISYSAVWIESMTEVIYGIDDKPSKDELKVMKIEAAIRESTDGFMRGELMRKFRLTADAMNGIEATLLGRGLVVVSKVNSGSVYRSAAGEL